LNNIPLLFLIIILYSCNTTPNSTYTYFGGNEFYPVVIKVFENNGIGPETLDIINNEFTSDYIYQKNYGAKIRYTVKVKYKNNKISVELNNVQQFSFNNDTWVDENRLTYFDHLVLPKKIADEINTILNNQIEYELVKNEVYNNFLFHYLVIKNLPKKEKNNWIIHHMLGRNYELNVTLSKFKKNNTGLSPGMSYIAEFTNNEESDSNDFFVINYFTNNKDFEKVGNKTPLMISGKLLESIDIADTLIHSSHINLVDN
jgi:hypothetical protein